MSCLMIFVRPSRKLTAGVCYWPAQHSVFEGKMFQNLSLIVSSLVKSSAACTEAIDHEEHLYFFFPCSDCHCQVTLLLSVYSGYTCDSSPSSFAKAKIEFQPTHIVEINQ